MDPGYQGMLLELVLLTAVEHGWPLSGLPGARVAAALQPHGYDPRWGLAGAGVACLKLCCLPCMNSVCTQPCSPSGAVLQRLQRGWVKTRCDAAACLAVALPTRRERLVAAPLHIVVDALCVCTACGAQGDPALPGLLWLQG